MTPTALARTGRLELLGVAIDDVTMTEALLRMEELVVAREPTFVVTPNVDHLVRLQSDDEFRRVYADAALVLADGMPLIWASRLLHGKGGLRERVAGSDLLPAYCREAAATQRRVCFVGGQPGAAVAAATSLGRRFPGLRVCEVLCPPPGFDRSPEHDAAVVAKVRAARPDVLFVGLGSPKQERWIHRNLHRLEVPVSVGVGAAFDMESGQVRRAPTWMRRVGLEWSWRLAMEPRRLWRRYLVEDSRFLALVAGELLRGWRHGAVAPTARS